MTYKYTIINPASGVVPFPIPDSLPPHGGNLTRDCGGCPNKSVCEICDGPPRAQTTSGNFYEVEFAEETNAQAWRDQNSAHLVGMMLYGVPV